MQLIAFDVTTDVGGLNLIILLGWRNKYKRIILFHLQAVCILIKNLAEWI